MSELTHRVDALFAEWDKPDSPGCALGVVRDDELVYSRGYGMANLEYAIPIVPSSVFHVASVSKQFAAMAMVLLARQGKLSLDDDVRAHLSELPDYGPTITIRHLILHTSGLRDQWDLLALAGWRPDDVKTNDDVLDLAVRQRELNFLPGAEWLYSNTGYTLLALIVERVTGQTLRRYADEQIFRPLGMTRTHFHDDHTEIVPDRAYAYEPRDDGDNGGEGSADGEGGLRISIPAFDTVGATSLFTTVEDLARWVRNFEERRVGGDAAIEQLIAPGRLNDGEELAYALGLMVAPHKGLRTIGHSGGDAGYRSHLLWFPDQRLGVVVLCNLGTMRPGELARKVADLYLAGAIAEGGADTGVAASDEVTLDEAELASKAGFYRSPDSGLIRELAVEDGKLVLKPGPGIVLRPLAADRFKAVVGQLELRFTEEDGALRLQVIADVGKPMVYDAVPGAEPTLEQLAEYTGAYRSDELGTTYTVALHDGVLLLRRRKFRDSPLRPTIADAFQVESPGFQLTFTRDGRGRVTGCVVATARVRALRFDLVRD